MAVNSIPNFSLNLNANVYGSNGEFSVYDVKTKSGSELNVSPSSGNITSTENSRGNLKVSSGMKRVESRGNMLDQLETRVMVYYTGGTIGMTKNNKGALAPVPNALLKNIRESPLLYDKAYANKRFGACAAMGPLVLPEITNETKRVIYSITEYDPVLDSSNMTMRDWEQIANDIGQAYELFDGFVVLHGTDTLSYTASALSFMLENLGKTIIVTGSQIPLFEPRSDGRDNFLAALILAGNHSIPEVCVFFNNNLYRGNRTIKKSSSSFSAFYSPNSPPLAKVGINVEVDYRLLFRPATIDKFRVHSNLNENVGLLRIFPSISTHTVKAFLSSPIEGVVLQTFGSGNVPSNRPDLMAALKEATDRGVIIVNITQCYEGSVSVIYETGAILNASGVLQGSDMTAEAALTKLCYVLSKSDWDLDTKKKMMEANLRGELTSVKAPELQDFDLVDAVARTLHLSAPRDQLGNILFPAMVNNAVIAKDIKKLEALKGYGANLSAGNCDLRTALHVACCEGEIGVVQHILLSGGNVHIRDRFDKTPLQDAIESDHHDVIKLLMKCGAHLTSSPRSIGEALCAAAERGCLKRLQSYRLAGADLCQSDGSGRTAAHVAALHGQLEVIDYLRTNLGTLDELDLLGLTPSDYAAKGHHTHIIELLIASTDK